MNIFAEAFALANKVCFSCAQKIRVDRKGNLVNKHDISCDHPIQGLLFDFSSTPNTSQESSNFKNGIIQRYVIIKDNQLVHSQDLASQVLDMDFFYKCLHYK